MSFPYTGSIKVRFADTDANGHAYFGSYLVLADEVVSEYWADLGWDFNNIHHQPTLTFMVNSNVDFVSECLPADVLDVGVGFTRIGRSSLTLEYEMTNRRTGELAAKGSFTNVFVEKATRKSCPIPAAFRARLVARQPELETGD